MKKFLITSIFLTIFFNVVGQKTNYEKYWEQKQTEMLSPKKNDSSFSKPEYDDAYFIPSKDDVKQIDTVYIEKEIIVNNYYENDDLRFHLFFGHSYYPYWRYYDPFFWDYDYYWYYRPYYGGYYWNYTPYFWNYRSQYNRYHYNNYRHYGNVQRSNYIGSRYSMDRNTRMSYTGISYSGQSAVKKSSTYTRPSLRENTRTLPTDRNRVIDNRTRYQKPSGIQNRTTDKNRNRTSVQNNKPATYQRTVKPQTKTVDQNRTRNYTPTYQTPSRTPTRTYNVPRSTHNYSTTPRTYTQPRSTPQSSGSSNSGRSSSTQPSRSSSTTRTR